MSTAVWCRLPLDTRRRESPQHGFFSLGAGTNVLALAPGAGDWRTSVERVSAISTDDCGLKKILSDEHRKRLAAKSPDWCRGEGCTRICFEPIRDMHCHG